MLLLGLLFSVSAHATPAPSTAESSSPPTLEVELDPAIPDASDLSEWIRDEATEALAELPPSPERRGTIRISVAGALYDYDVSIITIREGSTDEQITRWTCECTNDDLLTRVRNDVEVTASTLEPPPPPIDDSPKPALGPKVKIGFGLLGGGAAFTIVGLSLTAAGDQGESLRKAGIPLLAVGVAALVAGTTLVVLEQRRRRARRGHSRVAIVPFVAHRAAHLGVTGRF